MSEEWGRLASEGASANTGYCTLQPRKQALKWVFGGGNLPARRAHKGERVTERRRGKTKKRGRLSHRDPHKRPPQMARRSVPTIPLPANYNAAPDFTLSLPPPMPTLLKRWICFTWNNASPFFTPSNLCQQRSTMGPLFMDWQFKAWMWEMKWKQEKG